ncbi:MAG: transporter substrate-binding domain-containing protein [Anaerolineae bacterium]|nr:transporter substrate-binding domain-containing protein [Anaerolineae bacterium]
MVKRFAVWLGLGLFALLFAVTALPLHASPSAQGQRLRVATRQTLPFIIGQEGEPEGFTAELWDALSRRMNIESEWVHYQTDDELIRAVRDGQADVAVAALAMTPERELAVDFSAGYFDSGLQILVKPQPTRPILDFLTGFFSPALLQFFFVAFVIVFVLAHVLWLHERRENPAFQRGYFRGIGEGLWGVILIFATGEFGDRDLPDGIKRLIVAAMWLMGVVLIAQFTATVTSALTVQQLTSNIRGPSDLPGKTIATAPNSSAAQYLNNLGIPFVPVSTADQAYEAIMTDQVQAIVYDAPTLQWWAATKGKGTVQVVGPIFRPLKYGFAVKTGSPLRKQINQALLEVYDNGTYEDIYNKWFSLGN